MIAIRTDANATIGAGHLMRCLSIADGLRHMGEEAALITADDTAAEFITQAGVRHISLNSNWRLLAEEAYLLIPALTGLKASLLLVDSYLATPDYIKILNNHIKTATMDDLCSGIYPADILINYNITSDRAAYEAVYGKSGAALLLGTQYAPLRREFYGVKPAAAGDRLRRVYISAGGGGGQAPALTARLCQYGSLSDIRFVAAPGLMGQNGPLKALAEDSRRLEIVPTPQAVRACMQTCDAAVSAGGLTLYELCACGLPTAVFSLADNQTPAREAFCGQGVMLDCGDLRDGEGPCTDRVAAALESMKSRELRAALGGRAAEITDGLGAVRLAAALAEESRR